MTDAYLVALDAHLEGSSYPHPAPMMVAGPMAGDWCLCTLSYLPGAVIRLVGTSADGWAGWCHYRQGEDRTVYLSRFIDFQTDEVTPINRRW